MEYEKLIGSQVIIKWKLKRFQGQLLHIDPTSKLVILQAEKLMIFNRQGYDSIEPCYEQFTKDIPFYDPIPLFESIEEKRDAIVAIAKDYNVKLEKETIVIDDCCWIDPPYDTIVCPDPKRFTLFSDLFSSIL